MIWISVLFFISFLVGLKFLISISRSLYRLNYNSKFWLDSISKKLSENNFLQKRFMQNKLFFEDEAEEELFRASFSLYMQSGFVNPKDPREAIESAEFFMREFFSMKALKRDIKKSIYEAGESDETQSQNTNNHN